MQQKECKVFSVRVLRASRRRFHESVNNFFGWIQQKGGRPAAALELKHEFYWGMKAMPCGLTIPFTTSVNLPVSGSSAATEVGVALYAALGPKIFREIA